MKKNRRRPREETVDSADSPMVESAHITRMGSRHQVRIINEAPIPTSEGRPGLIFHPPDASPAEVEELDEDLSMNLPHLTEEADRTAPQEEQAAYSELGFDPPEEPISPDKESRTGRGAGQNEMLNDWFHKESQQSLRELYALYAGPIGTCLCKNASPDVKYFQCDDCLTDRHFCQLCLKTMHRLTPTHRISYWTGVTWSRTSLAEHGLVVKIANHQGCLRSKKRDLLLGDLTGFHNVHVTYCSCSGAADEYIQLLRSSIMPCSTREPESGFTFRSLRMFDFLAADAKLSLSKFHSVLQRQSNNIEPHVHQHRLRELLRVTREWTFLQALKRAGETTTQPRALGSLSIRCPACPRLNFNYIPSDVQEDTRYLYAQQLSYDGSFQLVRKNKAHDQFDTCLTDGLMYWVKQDDYKAHLIANKDTAYNQNTNHGTDGEGVDRCNNHRAANDTWVQRSGVAETGVGAITCARHTFFMPIGAVSYWKGERYGYTDFGAACQIWLLMSEGATEIGFFYDIYCQWAKNFWDRAPRILLPYGSLQRPARFFGGIPKYHLAGHIDSCYAQYSLNNMRGVGRLDAEGCERAWAHLNGASGSTSEKGPGARINSLNHVMNDWNWRKFVSLNINVVSFFLKKLKEAEEMAAEMKHTWVVLHRSLDASLTQSWAAMSTEPKKINGLWTSVFLVDSSAMTTRLRTVLDLNALELQRVDYQATNELGLTAPTWLSEGIDIERVQAKLKNDINGYGKTPTERQSMEIYNRRVALTSRITTHRQNAALFLDVIPTTSGLLPTISEETEGQPEVAPLYVPSQLGQQLMRTERSLRMIDIEVSLRRAECYETLRRVRTTCMQKSQTIGGKNKHARGEIANTRAQTMISRLTARVDNAMDDYNRSYKALGTLIQEDMLNPFQQLEKVHFKGLERILRPDRKTGEGRKRLPWFWTVRDNDTRSAKEAEEYEFNEAVRVEWFRGRERYRRWEEEVLWLRREIASTLFSYHSYSEQWMRRSESDYAEINEGYKAFCRRQSDLYMGLMISGYERSESALKVFSF